MSRPPAQFVLSTDEGMLSMPFDMCQSSLRIGTGVYTVDKATGAIVFERRVEGEQCATSTVTFTFDTPPMRQTTIGARLLTRVKLQGYDVRVDEALGALRFVRLATTDPPPLSRAHALLRAPSRIDRARHAATAAKEKKKKKTKKTAVRTQCAAAAQP
jgi:hypothetical protein